MLTINYGLDESMHAWGGVNVCCNLLATKTGADHHTEKPAMFLAFT